MSDRFRILRPLEPGPAVLVYLVRDEWDGSRSKVLTLLPADHWEELDPEELEEDFAVREALDHPRLLKVQEWAFRGRRPGWVTEYCSAPPLLDFCRGKEPALLGVLALQIAGLLAYLHGKGRFCGILKPSYFFVRPGPELLANLVVKGLPQTRPFTSQDTIRYASPEYLTSGVMSEKADLYALGMLLYRLVTGSIPYEETDGETLLQKQLVAEPVRPRRINPDIPPRLEELICDLLQKSQSLRPPSARYVVAVLEDLYGQPSEQPPPFSSPLVGHRKELQVFRSLLDEFLISRRSRFVMVTGPDGIGKSALTRQFVAVARARRLQVFDVQHCSGSESFELLRTAMRGERVVYRGCTQRRPRVIALPDLRSLDELFLKRCRNLLASGDNPAVVVGSRRTGEPSGCWRQIREELERREQIVEIELSRLTEAEAGELVSNLLGMPVPDDLLERIARHCKGNPFFIRELLGHLRETGELVFRQGNWEWWPGGGEAAVPASVAKRILVRVERLEAGEKAVLEYLSVLGKPVRVDLLARILGMAEGDLVERARILSRADLVSLQASLEGASLEVGQDWVLRVIQSRLAPARCVAIHRRIAGFLEAEYLAGSNPAAVEALVHHLLEGGARTRAKKYIWQAADCLQQSGLYREAASLVERALRQGVISVKDRDAALRLAELLFLSGQHEKCIDFIKSRVTPVEGRVDRSRAALVSLLARVLILRGETVQGIRFLDETLSKWKGDDAPDLFCEMWGQLLCCLSWIGNRQRSRLEAGRVREALGRGQELASADKLEHALFSFAYHVEGSEHEAIHWETKAIARALERGKLVNATGRMVNLAMVYFDLGDLGKSRALIQYTLKLSRELENSALHAFCRTALAVCYRKSGHHQRAVRTVCELLALNGQAPNPYLGIELNLELAKNLNELLLPERALQQLQGCQPQLVGCPITSARFEATLTRAWTWLLLGDAGEAWKILAPVRLHHLPRERGRQLLLRAAVHSQGGHLERAWEEAYRARETLPPHLLQSRSRVSLLQAEILLEREQWEEASEFLQESLELARRLFHFPLMAQSYQLMARQKLALGEASVARACGLRARQVARHVERPALRAEIRRTLGRIELALGRREAALQHFSGALQIYKSQFLFLSPAYREAFERRFVQPLVLDRDGVLAPEGDPAAPFLITLRRTSVLLHGARSTRDLVEITLQSVERVLPSTSLHLFLRRAPGCPFELAGSRGNCRFSGRRLISRVEKSECRVLTDPGKDVPAGRPCSLAVAFRRDGQLIGVLYLEPGRQGIPEGVVDFLCCLATLLEFRLEGGEEIANSRPVTAEREGLLLADGKRIVGRDPLIRHVFEEILRLADSEGTVLVLGESGTGKELAVRALHDHSRRRNGPFVPINCSALPAGLIENELFGHRQGSYTGADGTSFGLFERASGGTLFLDEISTMSVELQSRLLRVLQEKKIRRLGDAFERPVDVRVLAATNQPLEELVRQGRFRQDLYYRLNVHQLELPPLRRRRSDIPLLAEYFLERLNRSSKQTKVLAPAALERLAKYSFPGNVRELLNLVESAYHLCQGRVITAADLAPRLQRSPLPTPSPLPARIDSLVNELLAGRADFWETVRDPFLRRDLSREEVKEIISRGLERCQGSYRRLLDCFHMSESDYKRLLAFLAHHNCKVDFRSFRR